MARQSIPLPVRVEQLPAMHTTVCIAIMIFVSKLLFQTFVPLQMAQRQI
jgi:hypothetical protein